jgi:hypothetical protein
MIQVRIFPKTKSAAQSGHANLGFWILEATGSIGSIRDLETAWNTTSDTLRQLRLEFQSLDDARTFADKHQLRYTIEDVKKASPRRRTYAENFRHV